MKKLYITTIVFFTFAAMLYCRQSSAQTHLTSNVIAENQIPVILDTDIGEDIDDTWALAFLLCCPELDLRLVTTSFNDTKAKALIAAKFLHRVDKSHIPVGVGIKTGENKGYQYAWAERFEPSDYPGEIFDDGIEAMINVIHNATQTITIIVTGPATNIQELLRRDPDVINKVKIVASMGSIYKGYGDIYTPEAEYNVRKDTGAATAMFNAGWDITLAPLDVTSTVVIRSKEYQSLLEWITLTNKQEDEYSIDELVLLEQYREAGEMIKARESNFPYILPLSRKPRHKIIFSLMESYRAWLNESGVTIPADARSTYLRDLVAVYLAYASELLEMRPLNLSINFTGYTNIKPNGKRILTALNWRDQTAFQTMVVNRLLSGLPRKPEEEEAASATRYKRDRITDDQ